MRRRVGIVLFLALVAALFPLTGAQAATDGHCTDGVSGDFNNDGEDDLAIGVPFEDLGSDTDTGAVHVIYGSTTGLNATTPLADQFFTQANIGGDDEDGDQFGACLAVGDFNFDDEDDLAIGVPGENVGGVGDVGVVDVLYGSNPGGLSSSGAQQFSQATNNIQGEPEAGDRFGESLATGDFQNDSADDLAVGVPREDIGARNDAGAINIIQGVAVTGLGTSGNRSWFQDSSGVEDKSQTGDRFGSALAAGDFNNDTFVDLAIGVPFEDLDNDAGLVNVLYGATDGSGIRASGDQKWHQNSSGIEGQVESGDRFGAALTAGKFNNDGFADLAIGAPREDVGATSDAGSVNVIYGSGSKLSATAAVADQLWIQGSLVVDTDPPNEAGDSAEAGDQFGATLAAGALSADAFDDLVVGAPLEDSGAADEGAINVIFGSTSGLTESGATFRDQDGLGGTGVANDNFASSLATGNYNGAQASDIAIGIPGKNVGGDEDAGQVTVNYASGGPAVQQWNQDSTDIDDAAEPGDAFGSALG